ncbi:MAG: FAD-binding oxidoreductase [Burkholderiales bacterium]|jgi:FAD/FMN-containing dehydrogenase|nr:FAD-binding oxidoreductase [Burkholderiales bacterium]
MALTIDAVSLKEFSTQCSGVVLGPNDAGYDEARRLHNGMIDKRPALIARCRGTADVADAVRFARKHGLDIAVRGGGHNVAGLAVCDGGLMIDLSLMKGIQTDPAMRRVRAQAGVNWRELNRETQVHGLAVTGGVVSTTGIAGLTLGGGLGWLMGKHGLALDNLLSAEVVTASGEIVLASEKQNEDLFWALRGGGGNFGVVTWFEYRLHRVAQMTSGLVAHSVDNARDVLRLFRDATRSLPDELTLFSALLHAPDGSGAKLAAIIACHSGSLAEGEAALRPIKAFGKPLMDVIGPASYEATNMMLDAGFPRGALNYWKSTFLTELSDAAIDTMIGRFRECPSPMSAMVLEHVHGAAVRVGPTQTAFPHRREAYNLLIASEWVDPAANTRNIAWARETYDAMRPYAAPARYVNYLAADETQGAAEAAYGPNLPRLRTIKARYDPQNVFRQNHNIPPA